MSSALLVPIWLIAGGVVIAGMYVGRLFLVPIAFALLLDIVCRPLVRWMRRRLHFPATLSATLIILAIVGILVGGGYALAVPVKHWWASAPATFEKAESRLRGLQKPLQRVNELKDRVDHLTSPTSQPASQPTSAPTTSPSASSPDSIEHPAITPAAKTPEPNSAISTFALSLFGGVSSFIGGLTEVLFLALLLLSSDGMFLRKLRESWPDKAERASEVVHEAESIVLRYLIATVAMSVGQGIAVGLVLWWIGIPNPWLWAGLTMVLENIPYLGAAVMIALVSLASLAHFDSMGQALLAPGAYLFITNAQNNLLSPVLYGSRMKLNPSAIFVGVIFFWFVWGIPGAFVGAPILAIIQVATSRSERWKFVSTFLSN